MMHNIAHSITILSDGCENFRKYLIEGTKAQFEEINGEYVQRSLMLVTALVPVIGYDKASQIAHLAMEHDLTLKEAALRSGFVTRGRFRSRSWTQPRWSIPMSPKRIDGACEFGGLKYR